MAKIGLLTAVRGIGRARRRNKDKATNFPIDFDERTSETLRKVLPYSMISPERMAAICDAAAYIAVNRIPGDAVECGVWRGGGMMAIAYSLLEHGDIDRDLYLFDTFEGMPKPSGDDVSYDGQEAVAMHVPQGDVGSDWCLASLDEVKANMQRTGYAEERLKYIKGMVEKTIPEHAPDRIALLHLDTDWYSSTKHEMVHLFPRLCIGGVLIIDDYGYWKGSRKAVDEYLRENGVAILLNRVDGSRVGVKIR